MFEDLVTSVLIIGGVSLFIFFLHHNAGSKTAEYILVVLAYFLAVCAWPVWVANLTFSGAAGGPD